MKTKEMIKVMAAYDNGEQIQIRQGEGDDWSDVGVPTWNWSDFDYRIKPGIEKLGFVSSGSSDDEYDNEIRAKINEIIQELNRRGE